MATKTRQQIAQDTADYLKKGGKIKCYDNSGELTHTKTGDDSPISAKALLEAHSKIDGVNTPDKPYQVWEYAGYVNARLIDSFSTYSESIRFLSTEYTLYDIETKHIAIFDASLGEYI